MGRRGRMVCSDEEKDIEVIVVAVEDGEGVDGWLGLMAD
ncbi:MAG: hypothetical protein ACI8RZ_001854 [Myxococcota bacterium]|jgi:hypothetical protein